MSRPMLLVFLLLVLIITSQFEWKQQLVSDVDSSPTVSQKQQQISKREEGVKEKVISVLLYVCYLLLSLNEEYFSCCLFLYDSNITMVLISHASQ